MIVSDAYGSCNIARASIIAPDVPYDLIKHSNCEYWLESFFCLLFIYLFINIIHSFIHLLVYWFLKLFVTPLFATLSTIVNGSD